MPDFPAIRNVDRIVISPASPHSLGAALSATGSSLGAVAWPTANLAMFVPFAVHAPVTVVKMFVENGGTVSGNIDVGIYDAGGARLVSSGSTAQSGASAIQEFNITDTPLAPGLYYLACALNNTTGILNRFAVANTAVVRALGVCEMASAFALPATATFASRASNYFPFVAATLRAVI